MEAKEIDKQEELKKMKLNSKGIYKDIWTSGIKLGLLWPPLDSLEPSLSHGSFKYRDSFVIHAFLSDLSVASNICIKFKIKKTNTYHSKQQMLGNIQEKVRTRSTFKDQALVAILSEVEPKNIEDALVDEGWIKAMQEELDQFQKNDIEFEMSMMGQLKFFLGLQIKQAEDGIYIHQTNYLNELLKKFNLEYCKSMSTPMHPTSILSQDESNKKVDQSSYKVLESSWVLGISCMLGLIHDPGAWESACGGMPVVEDTLLRLDIEGPYALNKMHEKARIFQQMLNKGILHKASLKDHLSNIHLFALFHMVTR
ncbi:Copia protein, partial [Mucuna pruriens]